MSAESPMIFEQLNKVMTDVGAVGKGGFNDHQKFAFRGIDQVVDAVSPALIRNGVLCIPRTLERQVSDRQTSGGKPTRCVDLHIEYTFYASDGSSVSASMWGEGQDTADKSTSKAQAMAAKYALCQALMIATNDLDPDATTVDTAPAAHPLQVHRDRVNAAAKVLGWGAVEMREKYAETHDGQHLAEADAATLIAWAVDLEARTPAMAGASS